jgi:hypothetical protein
MYERGAEVHMVPAGDSNVSLTKCSEIVVDISRITDAEGRGVGRVGFLLRRHGSQVRSKTAKPGLRYARPAPTWSLTSG